MGMTYSQFWEESPYLVSAYRKAYRLKRETENEQAWLQGLYIYDAFAVVMANVFRKRGQKSHSYLENPIDIFPLTEDEKKRREAEAQRKMEAAMKAMMKQQKSKKKKQNQKGEK